MKPPDQGDILHLQFDPASGREMQGPHKSLDWKARTASLVERAPPEIVNAVLECLIAILEDE